MQDSSAALRAAAVNLLENHFGKTGQSHTVFTPGRVNLIGEHIDYHNVPVLPMALNKGICVAYRARQDLQVRAISSSASSSVAFNLADGALLERVPGEWGNYVKAAAIVSRGSFQVGRGIDAVVVSNLPMAAGLSSSTALLVAFTLALVGANGIKPSLLQLMQVLPEGEHFVGTRGGGMDQAAILASRQGHALHIHFDPFAVKHIPIPVSWRVLVADSLQAAEKSAALMGEYNARREAGSRALTSLGLKSYSEAITTRTGVEQLKDSRERETFTHVVSEAQRVDHAVAALLRHDLQSFGGLLNQSHQSLRDRLLVSTSAVNALVATALEAGAAGARITGAGFGGCIVAVCDQSKVERLRDTLKLRHFEGLSASEVGRHLFVAEPAAGALEIFDV